MRPDILPDSPADIVALQPGDLLLMFELTCSLSTCLDLYYDIQADVF